MGLYSEEWWFANGQLAANQRAAVFEEDQNTLASIFSDVGMTVPLANPTTTDASGILTFYAADGSYWIFVGKVGTGDSVLATIGASPDNPVLSVNGELPDGGGNVTLDSADIGAQPIATIDAVGDLYVGDGPDSTDRLPVGADTFVLTADSAEPLGVKWAAGGAGGIPDTIIDAKGDLIAGTAPDTPARLPVGVDGQVLSANSAQPTGLQWTAAPGGGIPATIFDAKGDIIAATAADTPARFPVGTDGQALRANSATATGLEWDTLTASDVGAVPTTRTLTAGIALSGGGDLSADRTFDVDLGTTAGTAAEGNDTRIVNAIQGTIFDAKGDIIAATAADTPARLPVGTDTFILSANSAQATGLEWIANKIGDVVGPGSATDNAVARFDGTTGKLIQNSNLTLSDGGSLGFTAQAGTAYANGQLFYNSLTRSICFDNDEPDIQMHIGQELWVEVRNTTGSTITKGQAVYINGTHASGIPTVGLAQSNALSTSLAVGLAGHPIENNTNGFITIYGTLNDVDTSAFSAADSLYLSAATPGAITATRPTAPNYAVRIGAVTKANPATGKIAVTPQNERLGLGTANQVLGMNAAGAGEEYKTLNGTANRLTVTHAANSVTFDVSTTLSDSFIPKAIVDAKGDLIVATAADTVVRQAVGTDTHVLTADSAQTNGIKWAVATDSGAIQKAIVDAKGDIIVATAADTVARQAVGTDGFQIFADSTVTNGLKWAVAESAGIYPRSTGYMPTGGAVVVRSSKTATADSMFLIPFYLLIGGTLSSIAFEVSGAVALAVVRTGIYASDSSLLPTGAAVADYGTTLAATTGTKTVAVSTALTPGLWFLAVVGQTVSPTLRFGAGFSPYVASATFPSGSGAGWDNGYVQTGVSAGLPTIGSIADTDTPMCGVKF